MRDVILPLAVFVVSVACLTITIQTKRAINIQQKLNKTVFTMDSLQNEAIRRLSANDSIFVKYYSRK